MTLSRSYVKQTGPMQKPPTHCNRQGLRDAQKLGSEEYVLKLKRLDMDTVEESCNWIDEGISLIEHVLTSIIFNFLFSISHIMTHVHIIY